MAINSIGLFVFILVAITNNFKLILSNKVVINSDNQDTNINRLSFIVEDVILNHLPPHCSLAMAWDSHSFSPSFQSLYQQHDRWSPAVVSNSANLSDLDTSGHNISDPKTRYLSWPANKFDAKSVGNCVLFVIMVENDLDSVLEEASKHFAFNTQRHYFIIWYSGNDTARFNETLFSSKTSLFKYKLSIIFHSDHKAILVSACFFCDHGNPGIIEIGTLLNMTGKMQWNMAKIPFPDFTLDMNNSHVRVVYLHKSSVAIIKQMRQNKQVIELTHSATALVAEFMNARWDMYEIDSPAEIQNEDGSWTGFVGDILAGKADVVMINFISVATLDYVSFAYPMLLIQCSFLTHPPRQLYSWKTVFKPFVGLMWLLVFLSILCTAIFFVFVLGCKFHSQNNSKSAQLLSILSLLFLSLIGWGPSTYPSPHSSRMFIAFWLLFAMIISCAYQCKLVGFVTFPAKEILPISFEELVDSDYQYGGYYKHMVVFQIILENNEKRYARILSNDMIYFDTLYECLIIAVTDNMACMSLRMLLGYESNQFLDKYGEQLLTVAPTVEINAQLGSTFRKNYIVLESYNMKWRRIIENGLYDQHVMESYYQAYRLGFRDKRRFDRGEEQGAKPMNIKQLQGPFICLVLGLGVASVTILIELSYGKIKYHFRNKVTTVVPFRAPA